jgi:hypothetical protein
MKELFDLALIESDFVLAAIQDLITHTVPAQTRLPPRGRGSVQISLFQNFYEQNFQSDVLKKFSQANLTTRTESAQIR